MDKATEALVAALKQAVSEPGEQSLYRSGKQPGLFSSRAGVNGEAAARALQDNLLEIVRSEEKGKGTLEWVRITPRGVEFVNAHESPVRVLEELRELLRTTQAGVPLWLAELQREWREAGARLFDEVQRMSRKLELLGERVEAALRRAEVDRLETVNGAPPVVAWAKDALAYLDRRGRSACPLPELFAALRPIHAELSIPDYLDGLRKLHERRALQLLPFESSPSELPQPEYALLDGASVMYYATRG